MKVSRWVVSPDIDATRSAYLQIEPGVGCDCEPCLNFEKHGRNAFPEEIHRVFESLGIDYKKPAEIFHNGRLETGLHYYGGWYHFVGTLEIGEDSHQPIDDSGRSFSIETEPLSETGGIGFSKTADLVNEAFSGQTVTQVEISVQLPWILNDNPAD